MDAMNSECMQCTRRRSPIAAVLAVTAIAALAAWLHGEARAADAARPERVDLLTFAQGAVPIAIEGSGAKLGVTFEKAIRAIDGNPASFVLNLQSGGPDTVFEFVYQLPAATRFDRFAVPNVVETPSPAQTFVRDVEVHGSAIGPDKGFVLLAAGTLATHRARGEHTELELRASDPVRWVKVRLRGGIQVIQPQTFFEFSEIVGNGTQESRALSTRFNGTWKGRGVDITLRQDGPLVVGCYDRDGELQGTVTGNILVALGATRGDRVQSAFVLSVLDDNSLRGVRSANRAPFALYAGEPERAGSSSRCSTPAKAALGCGSVVHGIAFDFDSATIRQDSEPVLARLADALRSDRGAAIVIEGHTSSEGSDDYNRQLSQRRAQAVVAALAQRGLESGRLRAVGFGESRPIADNRDENGRALNRRVEVRCS